MDTAVSFPAADGTTLRGRLWLPDGDGPWPGVVLNHGFSATVGMGLVEWASGLAEAGFAALAYDNRNLGASDGARRGLVDWTAQARDLRDALTLLAAHASPLFTWGSSFSGAQGLVVSTIDDRVRACVANVPYVAQSATAGDGYDALVDAIVHGTPATDGHDIGVFEMMPQPEARTWFESRATPDWRERVLLAGVPDPGVALPHVRVPVLAILATEDRIADVNVSRAALQQVPGVEIVEIAGDHFVPYSGEPFRRALAATIDFLTRAC